MVRGGDEARPRLRARGGGAGARRGLAVLAGPSGRRRDHAGELRRDRRGGRAARDRGRTRRTGLLFTAASVCWAANWAASWDATVGPIMSPYAQANFYLALMIGVLLYPSGRLEYLVDRIWAVLACAILWVCPTALWTTSKPEWAAFRGESVWWRRPSPISRCSRPSSRSPPPSTSSSPSRSPSCCCCGCRG
ncbi:hypothetical protein LUX57_00380 [Actinomadura madurae]|uniref:hypothetical protein n=1 Tax=Actinomadura madurae TaxID=1993 RepID=UPI0020D221BA|nr:hypothetical protein [Actinomadura madurae]MCP9963831.1 hypothetical protein [Actinomadura madurae]